MYGMKKFVKNSTKHLKDDFLAFVMQNLMKFIGIYVINDYTVE